MFAFDESATTDLFCALGTALVGCVFIGVILEYCVATIHHHRHPHSRRIGDRIAREIHAWRRHHARTHRKLL